MTNHDEWAGRASVSGESAAIDPGVSRRGFVRNLGALTGAAAVPALPAESTPPGPARRGVATLRRRVEGEVIVRGDPRYELLRQSMHWWSNKPERYPQVLVYAASESDIAEALLYARANGLRVTGKGGGHNASGAALREGGMVIDQSRLVDDVVVDPDSGLALARPMVRNRALYDALAAHGRAFPVCHCGAVPLSGYLLGGGQGWNVETWGGMACYSVAGAEMISAAGERIDVGPGRNEDLLWAIRGAGPGMFGIVTKYRLTTYRHPAVTLYSQYVAPLHTAGEVAGILQDLLAGRGTDIETIVLLGPAGRADPQRVCTANVFVFAGSAEEAKDRLAPFAASRLGAIARAKTEYQPAKFYGTFFEPPLARYLNDNLWTDRPASVLRTLGAALETAPSPHTRILCSIRAGTAAVGGGACAVFGRAYVAVFPMWADPAADVDNRGWLRTAMSAVEDSAIGHNVNEVDAEAGIDKLLRSFTEPTWARLQALRRRHDPHGVFFDYYGRS
jgi:FAD/FMN-containing dehydrogenase